MATEIVLPHLGEAIEAAVLLAWNRQVGEAVRRGDEIAEVETEKASMPLESPADGVLLAILAEAGSEVRTGQLVAVVGTPGEVWPPVAEAAAPVATAPVMPTAPLSPATAPPAVGIGSPYRITPAARARARELRIDMAAVVPATGDRVTAEDVDRHAAGSTSTGGGLPSHRIEQSQVRRVTGRRMAESARDIPQFSVTADANVTALESLRATLGSSGAPVTLTALLVAITGRVLARHPRLNATHAEDGVVAYDVTNIAVAVAGPDGLRVPVVLDAGRSSVVSIAARLADVVARARTGELTPDDSADATFTISNLGRGAVTSFVPLVNPPQSAILGIGSMRHALVPGEDFHSRATRLIALTVSADHRVVDGADAAAFLTDLVSAIERADLDTGSDPQP